MSATAASIQGIARRRRAPALGALKTPMAPGRYEAWADGRREHLVVTVREDSFDIQLEREGTTLLDWPAELRRREGYTLRERARLAVHRFFLDGDPAGAR